MKVTFRLEELVVESEINIESVSQQNYDLHAQAFNVALVASLQAEKIVRSPIKDDDHQWFRRMTASAHRSLRSVMLVCWGGGGNDAMKLARSVEELSRTAKYLLQDRQAFERFKSGYWKDLLRFEERSDTRERMRTMTSVARETQREFLKKSYEMIDRVIGREKPPGKKEIFERVADDAAYDIYGLLSSFVHMDSLALISEDCTTLPESQMRRDGWIELSLMMASFGLIRLMDLDNETGQLGLQTVVEKAKQFVCSQLSIEAFT